MTPGDIAVMQFGSDNKWHWNFLTPSTLSTLAFNTGTVVSMAAIGNTTGGIPQNPQPMDNMPNVQTVIRALAASLGTAAFQPTSAFDAAGAATSAVAALTAGSPDQLNTFLEAYNRFLTDESAASALTGALATETTNRTSGDATNAAAISAESTARASADTAEASTRAAADTTLTTAIAAKYTLPSGGTTVQYLRGDGSLASLPAPVTWSTLSGAPVLATVATSGSYTDLSNLPTIPAAQVSTDWNASSGLAQLLNKPTLGLAILADTGWTANNTAGDKTAALSSYSNGLNSTMIAALNLASSGTGTAISAAFDVLVIVVKKLAAIETALASNKLPNA